LQRKAKKNLAQRLRGTEKKSFCLISVSVRENFIKNSAAKRLETFGVPGIEAEILFYGEAVKKIGADSPIRSLFSDRRHPKPLFDRY
jgi:hypothetical protein